MITEFIVLGGGNTGRKIAESLTRRGRNVTLAGRDPDRLRALAKELGTSALTVDLTSQDSLRTAAAAGKVLINTVGPFARLAPAVVKACLETGTSYVDISNERVAVRAVLDLDDIAQEHGISLVTGAGFGVAATEGPLLELLRLEPSPSRVIVAAAAERERQTEGVRTTMAESIADGATTYVGGELVRSPFGQNGTVLTFGDRTHQVLPAPVGDLEAAHRISGANDVTAYVAVPSESAGDHRSLGYAEITSANGETHTAVLSTGEGVAFGVHVATETATRLLEGAGQAGAWTPLHLLGVDVATSAPGTTIKVTS